MYKSALGNIVLSAIIDLLSLMIARLRSNVLGGRRCRPRTPPRADSLVTPAPYSHGGVHVPVIPRRMFVHRLNASRPS